MKIYQEQSPETLEDAKKCLLAGGVIAIPTETVYGLLTRWDNEDGREKIYHLKHRPATKRLQMLAPNLEAAIQAGVQDTPQIRSLAARFWPGPLTLVVKNATQDDSIGIRIPDHPFVRRLLEECGCVCAATSANRSGTPAAINIQDALAGLDGEPDMAIDGGVITATGGKASTVISLLADTPMVIRTGVISLQQIAEALE